MEPTYLLHPDPALHERLVILLFDTGYPDYGIAMTAFEGVFDSSQMPPEVAMCNCIGATDSAHLFICGTLTDDELGIVARHEILHIMLSHSRRCPEDANGTVWGGAQDFEVSSYYTAEDAEIISKSERLHGGASVWVDTGYQNMTAEAIYEHLMTEESDHRRFEAGGGDGKGLQKVNMHKTLPQDSHDKLRQKIHDVLSQPWPDLPPEMQEQVVHSVLLHPELQQKMRVVPRIHQTVNDILNRLGAVENPANEPCVAQLPLYLHIIDSLLPQFYGPVKDSLIRLQHRVEEFLKTFDEPSDIHDASPV